MLMILTHFTELSKQNRIIKNMHLLCKAALISAQYRLEYNLNDEDQKLMTASSLYEIHMQ